MKVLSKYTIDHCIFISQHVNKQNDSRSNAWVQFYSYFVTINCFALPGLLIFFDFFLTGGIVFLINVFCLIFLRDKINKEAYKVFYRDFFSENEFRETEVELLEDGIACESVDGKSFFNWQSIKEIAVTDDTIYFFSKGTGIPVPKNSFEYGTQMQEFLIFAQARVFQPISVIKESRF